jgi:transposase-like protein
MEGVLESADPRSGKRRYWSIEEKRRIVQETLCSSASVASLAREHGLNANQLFYWLKLYHAGQLEPSTHVESSSDVRLLPVTVADEASHQSHGDAGAAQGRTGTINMSFLVVRWSVSKAASMRILFALCSRVCVDDPSQHADLDCRWSY